MNKCKIIKKLRYKILKNYISYVLMQRSSTRMFFTVLLKILILAVSLTLSGRLFHNLVALNENERWPTAVL